MVPAPMQSEALDRWAKLFRPVNMAGTTPPEWVIPNLLVPGFNLLVGAPKTFKSFLVLKMIASVLEQKPVGDTKKGRFTKKRGSIVYFNAEQSVGRIKHIYEKRVVMKTMQTKTRDWDWIMPDEAYDWQIDVDDGVHDLVGFIEEWKPMIVILDPLIHFHSIDENDPRIVRPILPIKKAMAKNKGALVVVHHLRKANADPRSNSKGTDWAQIRGSGALWGAADGAMMLSKSATGTVTVSAEYKDFPEDTWSWRPAA